MTEIQPGSPRLRVATYNVEALGEDLETASPTAPKTEKLKSIATAIAEVGADIVALEEVPSKEALDSFVDGYLPGDMYPYRQFLPTNDPRTHHMGVLSRYPITDVTSNRERRFPAEEFNRPVSFTRDVPEVDFAVKGFPLKMYIVHLKSTGSNSGRPNAKDPDRIRRAQNIRKAEVEELKRIIVEDARSMPSRQYIVAGDLNSAPTGASTRELTDPSSPAPLVDPMAGAAGLMANSHPLTNRRIDYILLSPGLAARVLDGSAQVHHSEAAGKASDHLPVVLTIDLGETEKKK